MAPIPRADLDGDNPSSDVGDSQDSPLRRQFSEPSRPQSTSTQISQSPEPMPRRLKCDWCGKLLMLPNDADISEEDVLNDHINEAHPKSISFSGYDGAEDGTEELAEELAEDGAEDGADDTYDENGDLQDDDTIEQDEPIVQAAKPEDDEAQDEEGEEIVVEITTDDNNGTQPTATSVNVSHIPETKRDLLDWLSNPRTGYSEEYRLRDAQWRRPDVKKRLERFWKVHDANKFSPNYDQEAVKCESTWNNAFHDPSKARKRDAPEPPLNPLPYKKPKVDKDQFLEVQFQDLDDLISMLRTPEKYTPEELYALTQAGAFAMKAFQDEYLALDDLYLKAHRHKRDEPSYQTKRQQMQGHKKKGGAPLAHVNEDKLDFEEKKEAMLYGYKHNYFSGNTPLVPIRTQQDPFVQGGFVPTPAQARKMIAKNKETGDLNPDGWATMKKHGLEYHAQMYEPRREPLVPKVTRKRKAAEVEVPTKTTDAEETQNESADGDETDEDNHPTKRRTRGRGGKTVIAESSHSDTNATSRRGSGRGRGRGRGRGLGRLGSSRATFEVTPAPTQPASRGRGRRGASSLASSSIPPAETSFPAVEPTATESPVDSTPTSAKKEALSAEAIEEARRQKIANSKNPKRTKAMLDHWDRFNREGRIRNPKRSKAQIEQDRTVDGAADEVPKPTGPARRKRSPSLAPLAGNLAPKGPTGLPSMASVQAQQQQPMPPTLPPMGVVPHYGPGPVNPFAAAAAAPMAQLGQPMPPQYAPFPYVQYHGMGGPLPGHNPRDPRH